MEYLQTTQLQRYRISSQALRQRWPSLATELTKWGAKAKQRNATCTIYAPTDADARWIYQQMNKAKGALLGAQIEYQAPPKIELRF